MAKSWLRPCGRIRTFKSVVNIRNVGKSSYIHDTFEIAKKFLFKLVPLLEKHSVEIRADEKSFELIQSMDFKNNLIKASKDDLPQTPQDELVKNSLLIFEIFTFLELLSVAKILF